ncbi:MAG: ATP-grasp domain-containing protein [Spirochaetia bacterium]|nr:ATP-grasp domain-containing protein [Spirochaetia bacterium]
MYSEISSNKNSRQIIVVGGNNLTPLQVARCAWRATGKPVCFLRISASEESLLGDAICSSKALGDVHKFKSEKEAVDYLLMCAESWHIPPVVFTASDSAAEELDKQYEQLSKKYILSNCYGIQGSLNEMNSKERQTQLAQTCGIQVPSSTNINWTTSVETSELPLPCLYKPLRSSCGGKDIVICRSLAESKKALEHYRKLQMPVQVQEFIEKDSEICLVGASSFTTDKIVIPGVLQKIRESCRCGSYCLLRPLFDYESTLASQLVNFVRSCGYRGLFSVDCIVRSGVPYFLEMNFRADANLLMYADAGYNLVGDLLAELDNNVFLYDKPIKTIHGMDERTDSWNIRSGTCSWPTWIWQYLRTECKYIAWHHDRKVAWKFLKTKFDDVIRHRRNRGGGNIT